MKLVIITFAVIFNLTVVLLYARGLVSPAPAVPQPKSASPAPERSASSPYIPAGEAPIAPASREQPETVVEPQVPEVRVAKAALEPVLGGDGKETIDAKDGKELQPVAGQGQALRLRSPLRRPPTETLPGEARGILAPANRANLDPPIVSPEAR